MSSFHRIAFSLLFSHNWLRRSRRPDINLFTLHLVNKLHPITSRIMISLLCWNDHSNDLQLLIVVESPSRFTSAHDNLFAEEKNYASFSTSQPHIWWWCESQKHAIYRCFVSLLRHVRCYSSEMRYHMNMWDVRALFTDNVKNYFFLHILRILNSQLGWYLQQVYDNVIDRCTCFGILQSFMYFLPGIMKQLRNSQPITEYLELISFSSYHQSCSRSRLNEIATQFIDTPHVCSQHFSVVEQKTSQVI